MNKTVRAEYEALWNTKHERLEDWVKMLSEFKLELQNDNRINPSNRNNNYYNYLRQCRDRGRNSIAGTIYCHKRNKHIDHFEYISVH